MLLSHEIVRRKTSAEGIASNALGTALTPAGRAYIFCDRIDELAAGKPLDAASLLGKLIAHEVGHLLLPINGDAKEGIMRADLNLQASFQRFTSAQGDTIRTRIATMASTNVAEHGIVMRSR